MNQQQKKCSVQVGDIVTMWLREHNLPNQKPHPVQVAVQRISRGSITVIEPDAYNGLASITTFPSSTSGTYEYDYSMYPECRRETQVGPNTKVTNKKTHCTIPVSLLVVKLENANGMQICVETFINN